MVSVRPQPRAVSTGVPTLCTLDGAISDTTHAPVVRTDRDAAHRARCSQHDESLGGGVTQGAVQATTVRGCRVVTTSMTARLLLANQLSRLQEISWTVVSGDALDDPPGHVVVEVVPIRREFSPSDVGAFVRLWRTFRRERFNFVQTHTPKASFLGLPAARLSGTDRALHDPWCAVLPRQWPIAQRRGLALRNVVLCVGESGTGPEQRGS